MYVDYKDIFKVIRKRIFVILPVIIAVMAGSIFYRTRLEKPVYEARASLIIGSVINYEKTQFQIDDVTRIQNYMQTYVMILKTNVVAEKTIKTLGLDISTTGFKKHIQAEPQPDTQFMEIRVKWENPETATAVLDAITEIFIQEAVRIYPTYSIKILEKAGPYLSESLGDSLYYAVSLAGSVIIALLIILIIEFFDNTIKTEEDIEQHLKIPVIGTIPRHRKLDSNLIDHIKKNNYSSFDVFRTIRTNLLYLSRKSELKTLVVTSARPKEGKSTSAAMLAIVLAQGGKKTLLIDCDLRNPSIDKLFHTNGYGLSNILVEGCDWLDIVCQSELESLYVLPAGSNTLNPVEIISSDEMKDLIKSMEELFDYIILDTPPVGLFTEAQVLSQFTDGYLIIVSANESDRQATSKAVKLLQMADGKIIGALLNKVSDTALYKNYYRYYNSYSRSRKG
jgi:capsular exopolysaccharide synthesis family protein